MATEETALLQKGGNRTHSEHAFVLKLLLVGILTVVFGLQPILRRVLPPPKAIGPKAPTNAVQLEQLVALEKELQRVDLMGGISREAAAEAYKNLYGNFTQNAGGHIDFGFLPGVRVQIIGGRQFLFKPEPPELEELAAKNPAMFSTWFEVPAAHILSFLSATAAHFPLPDIDFTVAIGDFCFDATHATHEEWGNGPPSTKAGAKESPPNDVSDVLQAPVFAWGTSSSGRRTCNAVTMPTYDWNWYLSSFMNGSSWRLDRPGLNPIPWEVRKPKLVWRGSLIGEDGIRARALRLGLLHPDLLDVKVVRGGIDCDKYFDQLNLAGLHDHTGPADCQSVQDIALPLEDQRAYQYILEMDGGGSTFRFKNALLGGFLVFKVDSMNKQFFFQSLQPFVHYVPVDAVDFEADLLKKLEWVANHPHDAKLIASAAEEFARTHLTEDSAHWQQQAALWLYAEKQQFDVVPAPGMKRFCCEDLKMTKDAAGAPISNSLSCKSLDEMCITRTPRASLFWDVEQLRNISTPPSQSSAVQSTWKELSSVLQNFTIPEGFVMQEPPEIQTYQTIASQEWVKTICETGFNAGHSATLLLLSNPKATLYSFDLGFYPYSKAARLFVESKFPGRFVYTQGDSTATLLAFPALYPGVHCDMIIVDGGHALEVARADIANFQRLANPVRHVLLVDDTACNAFFCKGPQQAWDEAVAAGTVVPLQHLAMGEYRGFSVGEYGSAGTSYQQSQHVVAAPIARKETNGSMVVDGAGSVMRRGS